MNYDLTTLTNYDGAFGQFRSESEMAFQADSDFEPSGSGETVPDVPAGFCDVQVYADLAGAQQALLALEENAFLFLEVTNQQEVMVEAAQNICKFFLLLLLI